MTANENNEVPADESESQIDVLNVSHSIQAKVSSVGFDWPDITGVFDKVEEELNEIRDAWGAGEKDNAKDELGDLLFATVNLSRFLDVAPVEALKKTNSKFLRRYALMEEKLSCGGLTVESSSFDQLDAAWECAKEAIANKC